MVNHTRRLSIAVLACSLAAAHLGARPEQGVAPPVPSRPVVEVQNAPGKNVLPAALDLVAFDKNLWSLAFAFSKAQYQARSSKDVIADIDAFAALEETDQQHVFVKKYRAELDRAIGTLGFVGKDEGRFVYHRLPVVFAWKGDSLAVVITGVASSSVYNTLRLDVNKRATMALRGMVIPSMEAFDAFKNASELKYYGISVLYGSKDFLDASALWPEPENLTFIVGSDQCRKFVAHELTEDELVAGADIYISDRDMIGIKKIKLTLQ